MEEPQKPKNKPIFATVLIVTAIVVIAAILSAATLIMFQNRRETKNYSASYVADEVVKRMNYDTLQKISPENIGNYYQLPEGLVSDSAMYVSARPDSSRELACFILSEQKNQDALMEAITEYIADRTQSTQNAKENKSASSAVHSRTKVHYPYVFVVISSDCDTAVNTFETILFEDTSSDQK